MPLLTASRTHADYGMTITDATGNSMLIDIPVNEGGTGKGMRPMQTLLAAFCGCSAVDVVSILKKQKQDLTDLQILVYQHVSAPGVGRKLRHCVRAIGRFITLDELQADFFYRIAFR